MSRIKHTKTELKAQMDALKRFQRFLPMLQLKKQQLQMEIAAITARLDAVRAREEQARSALDAWSRLFADADAWSRVAILNVARSGRFSSDRTIAEYADAIWSARPVPIGSGDPPVAPRNASRS